MSEITEFVSEVAHDELNGVSMGRVEGVIGGVRYAALVPPSMIGDRPAEEHALRRTAAEHGG